MPKKKLSAYPMEKPQFSEALGSAMCPLNFAGVQVLVASRPDWEREVLAGPSAIWKGGGAGSAERPRVSKSFVAWQSNAMRSAPPPTIAKVARSTSAWERVAKALWDSGGAEAFAREVEADPLGTLKCVCSGERSAATAIEAMMAGAARAAVEAGAPLAWESLRAAVFGLVKEGRHETLAQVMGSERAAELKAAAIAGLEEEEKGATLLMAACARGRLECVKMLLGMGADPEARSKGPWREGWKALHHAASNSDKVAGFACAEALLAAGADPGRASPFSWGRAPESALEVAAMQGNERLARRLVKAGADPNTKCKGVPALALAATFGHRGVASELIAAGARLDEPDEKGVTPLMAACKAGQSQIARKLLDAGSRLDLENKWGQTARSLAEKLGGCRIGRERILGMLDAEPARREAAAIAAAAPRPAPPESGAETRKLRI